MPASSAGSSSTTVTREPSAEKTAAISRPMIPPPITSRRCGISSSASAAVESMMRGSSGLPGRRTAREPAARIACWKPIRVGPESVVTSTSWGETRRASPRTTFTPRRRASPASPSVSRCTTASLRARIFSRSKRGGPNSMPARESSRASVITSARCSSVFEGMQPTLRHTPPSFS